MTTSDLEVPARALAIGAHPDDIEFGCGGTLAKWAQAGCQVFHLVCTDGSKGTWNPEEDQAALVETRQHEQRAAALALGATGEVVFLGIRDGELESGLPERMQIARWIRELTPDVVLGHDPWKRYRLHPDHRNAGLLTTDGIVAARDPLFFPELDLAPHRPKTLLLFEAEEEDHLERIDATIEQKIAALLEHRSQLRTTMDISIDDSQADEQEAAFRSRITDVARDAGASGEIALAEAFKRIDRL